jgi:hypothetical protein
MGEGKGEGKTIEEKLHAQKNNSASFLLDTLGSCFSRRRPAAEESLADRVSILVRSS